MTRIRSGVWISYTCGHSGHLYLPYAPNTPKYDRAITLLSAAQCRKCRRRDKFLLRIAGARTSDELYAVVCDAAREFGVNVTDPDSDPHWFDTLYQAWAMLIDHPVDVEQWLDVLTAAEREGLLLFR